MRRIVTAVSLVGLLGIMAVVAQGEDAVSADDWMRPYTPLWYVDRHWATPHDLRNHHGNVWKVPNAR